MNTKILPAIFFIIALLHISPFVLNAQDKQIFTLTAEKLANGKTADLNEAGWKYHAGNDANWAKTGFDDAGWETLDGTILTLDNLPKSGWNGIGWFRLRLTIDDSLINQQLALIMDHFPKRKKPLSPTSNHSFSSFRTSAMNI